MSGQLQAQPLSGIKNIPGDYADITVAVAALNTNGVAAPGVTFVLGAAQTLSAALEIGSPTLNGSATALQPVTFNGNGFTINANFDGTRPGSLTSGNNDGAIVVKGTDYITFSNIVFAEQLSNNTATLAIENAIALYNANSTSPFDGCTNITITGCTFSFGKAATVGAAVFSSSHIYTGTTSLAWSTQEDRNRVIVVDNNVFNGSYNHVVYNGATTANGKNVTVTNNTMNDIGGGSSTSYGFYALRLDSLVYNGNIASTSLSQTTTNYIAFASTNCGGYQEANGNDLTIQAGVTTSASTGINYTSIGENRQMNNNIIKFGAFPNITSGAITGIVGTYSGGNNNIVFQMNDNICSNQTLPTTTGTVIILSNGASSGTNRAIEVNSNTISNLTRGGSGTFNLIVAGTANSVVMAGNTVSNIIVINNTASGATTLNAISSSLSAPLMDIYSNTVSNISVSGTSTSTSGIIRGIYSFLLSTTVTTIYNNTVSNLEFAAGTHTGTSNGIVCNAGTLNAYKNKVYNIRAAQSLGFANGLLLSAGGGNIYNNLIGGIYTPDANTASNTAPSVRGISLTSTTTSTNINLSYNTVYIDGGSTGSTFTTAALFATVNATATTANLTLKNNIFVNNATPNGSGLAAAYVRSGTALDNYNSASNNNLFYAGAPSASNVIFFNGTAYQTIGDFVGLVTPRELASVTENPVFVSTTGSSSDFLHINTSMPTQVESGGMPVSGITDDFDGNTRNATMPDLGGDEFNGVLGDPSPPSISFTPLSNTCAPGAVTLTATISDPSGVPTAGIGLPVLYWRLNSPVGPFTAVTATWTGGNQYEFTFGGAAVLGDEVYYYIVAQDENMPMPNIGSSPFAGASGFTANPPAAATPPTTPVSYEVQLPVMGTYTVGAAGNFPRLTDAANFYNNTPCLAGAVVFELIDANYPSEVFPINFNQNPNANAINTLTIRPAAGNVAVISGSSPSSIIRLNGADYVTIDGSNSSGTDRSLSLENTSTAAATCVINVASLGTNMGATYATIKNCNVIAGSSTAVSSFGIFAGGTSLTNTGTGDDNDYLTIQNNAISKAYYGIYAAANTTGVNDIMTITGNAIGSNTVSDQIGLRGIHVVQANAATISQNTIFNIIGTANNPTGLFVGAGVLNSTVSRNEIHGIIYTGTGGYGGKGIDVQTGSVNANLTIDNNFIYNISGDGWSAFTSDAIIGIRLGTGTAQGNIKVYYNSVNLFGPISRSGATADLSAALYVGASLTNIDIRNNIFVNSLENTTGVAKAYSIYSASANTAFTSINHNDYHVAGPEGVLAFLGSDRTNLLAWQSATGQDGSSLAQNPVFLSNTDLHINPAGTPIESGGTPIAGITTDFDGNTRNVTMPDIGGDEGIFTLLDLSGPGITYTNVSNSICVGAINLSAAITDASNVNVTAGTKPRIWYKKSTEMNVLPATNTSASDGWKYVEATNSSSPFNFDIDYSLLTSAVVSGDVIQYFVVAQDLFATPNVGTNTATYNTAPTSVALGAGAFPVSGTKSYSIINSPVSVVSQTSSNQLCITGNVTLSLTGDPSTGAEYQWESSPAGANTWSPISGATTATYVATGVNADTDFRCVISCGGVPIAASPSAVATVDVSSPMVLSTTPGAECGPGPESVALAATASGGADLKWYDVPTGGASIFTGANFNTPPISTTTTYYVAASEGGGISTIPGDGDWDHFTTLGAFQTTLITGAYMILTVSQPLTLSTMDIYPSATLGTAFTIEARTGSASGATFATYGGTTTVVNTGTPTVAQTVPVNWVLPIGTYYIGFVTTNPNTWRSGLATHTLPWTLPGVVSMDYNLTPSYQYYFYNLMVTTGCETPRVPVTASILPVTTWYQDNDGDTYGNASAPTITDCIQPTGYVANNTDCNDTNMAINPAAAEICNGTDDNCNTLVDDNDPGVTGQPTWYADTDSDTYGNPSSSVLACNQPANHVADNTDCDDTNAAINPAAAEICNNIDDDCSGSPEAATNNWNGLGNGTSWDDADNWSDDIVPLTCQHVVLPATANVTIPAAFEGKGLTLEVATGAILTMQPTALLHIINP